jgi:RimJ/RimL family protein N-acetyltransferase
MHLILEPIAMVIDSTNDSYAGDDCRKLLAMWEDYYPKIGYHPPWIGYFIKRNGQIVGACGFTGPPKENRVEVSYWTFEEYERQGIATEVCQQMVALAKKAEPAIVITAKTRPQHNASTKILERNHFVFNRVVQDHEIGDAWEWIFSESLP